MPAPLRQPDVETDGDELRWRRDLERERLTMLSKQPGGFPGPGAVDEEAVPDDAAGAAADETDETTAPTVASAAASIAAKQAKKRLKIWLIIFALKFLVWAGGITLLIILFAAIANTISGPIKSVWNAVPNMSQKK